MNRILAFISLIIFNQVAGCFSKLSISSTGELEPLEKDVATNKSDKPLFLPSSHHRIHRRGMINGSTGEQSHREIDFLGLGIGYICREGSSKKRPFSEDPETSLGNDPENQCNEYHLGQKIKVDFRGHGGIACGIEMGGKSADQDWLNLSLAHGHQPSNHVPDSQHFTGIPSRPDPQEPLLETVVPAPIFRTMVPNSITETSPIQDQVKAHEKNGLHIDDFEGGNKAQDMKNIKDNGKQPQEYSHELASKHENEYAFKDELMIFKDVKPDSWAFIYTMKLGIPDSLYFEITQHKKKEIESFISSLASNFYPFMNHEEFIPSEELTNPRSRSSFNEFAHLIWCVNGKFLRILNPTDEDYYNEQMNLYQHVLYLFSESEHQVWEEGGRKSIKALIIRALSSSYTLPTHNILTPASKILTESICPSQILMAQAVVHLMASYYKPKDGLLISNSQKLKNLKWTILFEKDKFFVMWLEKIQYWNILPPSHKNSLKSFQETINGMYFLPWSEEPSQKTLELREGYSIFPMNFVKNKTQIERIVKEIPREGGNQLEYLRSPENGFHIIFDTKLFQKFQDKSWKRVSNFGLNYQKFIKLSDLQVDESLMLNLKHWKSLKMKELLGGPNPYPRWIRVHNYEQYVTSLLEILWKINTVFIYSLGHHSYDKVFLDEQIGLQNEFYSLLTCSDNPQTKTFYKNNPGATKQNPTQKRIIEAFNFDERVSQGTKLKLLTMAAVEVILSYYSKNNPGKYLAIFLNQEIFISFLVRIGIRTDRRGLIETFLSTYFKQIQGMELFPWRKNYIKRYGHVKLLTVYFQANRSG